MAPLKLSEILSAFSLAIDLAENKPPGHARRVALLAVTLAMAAGLPRDEVVTCITPVCSMTWAPAAMMAAGPYPG